MSYNTAKIADKQVFVIPTGNKDWAGRREYAVGVGPAWSESPLYVHGNAHDALLGAVDWLGLAAHPDEWSGELEFPLFSESIDAWAADHEYEIAAWLCENHPNYQ